MAGECREVHIQGVEIHRHVRYGLAGVQHHQGAYRAGSCHQGWHIRNRPGHIRLVGERYHFHSVVQFQGIHVDTAVFGGGIPFQCRTGAAA